MQQTKTVERLIWAALWLTVVAIVALFALSRLREKPLPVYGSVSDFTLTNQLGALVSTASLRGQVWIADIIFTRCPAQCAIMTRKLALVAQAVPSDQPVKFVSLTADPGYDTPAVLKAYAERFGIANERWHFLTGEKRAVYTAAMDALKLAVDEKPPSQRESIDDLFLHSTRFAVVDKQGQLRGWFDLDAPDFHEALLAAVKSLEREN
jgi:protein SCO1